MQTQSSVGFLKNSSSNTRCVVLCGSRLNSLADCQKRTMYTQKQPQYFSVNCPQRFHLVPHSRVPNDNVKSELHRFLLHCPQNVKIILFLHDFIYLQQNSPRELCSHHHVYLQELFSGFKPSTFTKQKHNTRVPKQFQFNFHQTKGQPSKIHLIV